MILRGTVWMCGDQVASHQIVPAKYLYGSEPSQLAAHLFEGFGEEPPPSVGSILWAGRNFGHGSAAEIAVLALKAAGVQAVLARSFARPFFRTAINQALPALTCDADPPEGAPRRHVEVDVLAGRVVCGGVTYACVPLPETLRPILQLGGLLSYTRHILQAEP
jgi:3-isopropylmalate/(R)-2-methylmalate dehydratase small subunit